MSSNRDLVEFRWNVEIDAVIHSAPIPDIFFAFERKNEKQVLNYVRSHLQSKLDETLRDKWIYVTLDQGLPASDLPKDYRFWTILQGSGSIDIDNPWHQSHQHRGSIELVSPKKRFRPHDIEHLTTILDAIKSQCSLYVNPTCALRFNLGMQDDSLMPLRTVKHFMTLALFFEQLIDKTQDQEHIECSTADQDDLRYYPFSDNACPLHDCLQNHGKFSVRECCEKVMSMKSHEKLVDYFNEGTRWHPFRKTSFSTLGLDRRIKSHDGKPIKPTIECRRFTASVDPLEITNDLKLLQGMLALAHDSNDKEIRRIIGIEPRSKLKIKRRERDWTLKQFLRMIALENDVVDFFVHRNCSIDPRRIAQQEPISFTSDAEREASREQGDQDFEEEWRSHPSNAGIHNFPATTDTDLVSAISCKR